LRWGFTWGAPQEPLLFYACGFEGLQFRRSARAHEATRATVRAQLNRHLLMTALLQSIMHRLDAQAGEVVESCTEAAPRKPKHVPLLQRGCEAAVEERLAKYGRVLTNGHGGRKAPPEDAAMPMAQAQEAGMK
jgi:hypothetical protein